MFKLSVIFVLSMFLYGCAPTIVDRDFAKEEAAYIKAHGEPAKKDPLYQAPTADYILAAHDEGVYVSMYKGNTETYKKMPLQLWNATVINQNKYPVCVLVQWKLMDFEMFSDYPDFTWLQPNQVISKFAEMKQQVWNLNGTEFTLPPSGYVNNLMVLTPKKGVKKGQECVFEASEIVE